MAIRDHRQKVFVYEHIFRNTKVYFKPELQVKRTLVKLMWLFSLEKTLT